MSTGKFTSFHVKRYRSLLDVKIAISDNSPVIVCGENNVGKTNLGIGHRLGHRLKPVSAMQNLLKQVDRSFSAFQRTLPDRRRFQSAGLAETMTVAPICFAPSTYFSIIHFRMIFFILKWIFHITFFMAHAVQVQKLK